MKLIPSEIIEMENSENFDMLLPLINTFYKKFDFAGISEKEIKELVLNEIDSSKKTYEGDISYKEFIRKKVDASLIEKVKKKLNNSEDAIIIINNFINKNFKHFSNYDDSLDLLKKLSSFFQLLNYIPSFNLMLDMIKNNKLFFESIGVVVNKHKDKIISGDIEKVFDNSTMILIIECYCILNNIEINEKDDFDFEDYDDNTLEIPDDVKTYLTEIGRIKLLSKEEEKKIAIKAKQGDVKSKNLFLESYLKLVVSIARQYQGRGLAFLELIQEGNMGLMIAFDKFDVERGFRFSTYASYWIKQSIRRAIANKGRNIRIPAHIYVEVGKYINAVAKLEKKLKREPTIPEIAHEMELTIPQVVKLHNLQVDTVSINTLVGEDNDTTLEDFISDSEENMEDTLIASVMRDEVKKLLQDCNLKQREVEVLMLRFGFEDREPMTLDEIGKKFKVSLERIRQIEAKALKTIRNSKRVESFAEYMQYPDKSIRNIEKFRKEYEKAHNSSKTFLKDGGRTVRKERNKVARIRSIYEYLNDYTKEEIDMVLLNLSAEEKKLIILRYGNDLNNPVPGKLTKQQTGLFYGNLIPKIKRLINNLKIERNYGVNKPDENQSNGINDHLNDADNKNLSKIPNNTTNSSDSENYIPTLVQNDNLEKKNFSKTDYLKFLELIKTPKFSEMLNELSIKEAVIISLKLGYIDGKYFSTKSIAEFLDIEEDEVIKITEKVLMRYKENINQFLDDAIDTILENPLMLKNKN